MTTNDECNNDGVTEAKLATDSTVEDSAPPSADDVNNDHPSPPEQKVEKAGADAKPTEELLLHVHDPSNDNDEEPSVEEEVVTEDVEEKEAPSMSEDAVATSQNVEDTTNNENENVTTPPPPKVDEELVKQLHSVIESYEQMRRVNLEMEYSSVTPSLPPCMAVNHERCTYCQREAWERFILNPTPMENNGKGGGINIGSLKLDGSRIKTLDGRRIRRLRNNVGNFFARQNNENNQGANNNNEAREEDDGLFVKPADEMDAAPKEDVAGTVSASGSSNSFEGESVNSNTETETIEIGSSQSNSFEGESGNRSTKPQRKKFLQRKHPPCLTCGNPVCGKHQSSTFSTSNIRVCEPCARLFELDFLVDVITTTASNTAECRKQVNQMVDCYDRAKLLLLFTSQYTDQIAAALEQSTARSNKIGVGSSATGIVSGMAGVVGCGALLFPPAAAVGIPLLVSSLVFGGAATVAQTGDAAAQHFSEPNKLADKMVTLHAMMLSLLRISEVLSNGLLKDHDYLDGDVDGKRRVLAEEINALLKKHGVAIATEGVKGLSTAMIGGAVAAEAAVAGAELSATSIATTSATVAGRSSRFFGRLGTTAASGARFIPIAGGLLSAACVVVEGKELKKTVARINEGNPCAKAEQIRSIRDEIEKFPDSSIIADDCRRVFEIAEKECAFF